VVAWGARSSRRRRAAIALALVVACHVALIVVLNASRWHQTSRAAVSVPAQRITLRLIAPTPPAASPPLAARSDARERPPATPRAARPPRTERVSSPRAITPATTATPSHDDATAPTALAAPSLAASAPDALPSLMDTEATRRAIRNTARAPSLGDQLAQSREEPRRLSANDRLAIGVRQAGKGDCLKGEYLGGGMGLFSLPFLAVAAAAGNCAK